MIDFCAEIGLFVGKTYLEHKSSVSKLGWPEAKMEWR